MARILKLLWIVQLTPVVATSAWGAALRAAWRRALQQPKLALKRIHPHRQPLRLILSVPEELGGSRRAQKGDKRCNQQRKAGRYSQN